MSFLSILSGVNAESNELRLALNLLLQNVLAYQNGNEYNLKKFNEIIGKIHEQIILLTDEENSQEEEEIVLKHAVCVMLKFYEINLDERKFRWINKKSFGKKSVDDFMNCSPEEMKKSMEKYG